MTDEVRQPAWPSARYPTKEAAIAAALATTTGDAEVTIHQAGCAMDPCDCTPEVRIIREGLA